MNNARWFLNKSCLLWEFYEEEIRRMVCVMRYHLLTFVITHGRNFQYDEGEARPPPPFLRKDQPSGWQLPPQEQHLCIPQFVPYEAYGLSPPLSPFICDRRGFYYLCECEGAHYMLHGWLYDIWRIEEPKSLEGIVQILPDVKTLDQGEELLTVLKSRLKLVQLKYDKSKREA